MTPPQVNVQQIYSSCKTAPNGVKLSSFLEIFAQFLERISANVEASVQYKTIPDGKL